MPAQSLADVQAVFDQLGGLRQSKAVKRRAARREELARTAQNSKKKGRREWYWAHYQMILAGLKEKTNEEAPS